MHNKISFLQKIFTINNNKNIFIGALISNKINLILLNNVNYLIINAIINLQFK